MDRRRFRRAVEVCRARSSFRWANCAQGGVARAFLVLALEARRWLRKTGPGAAGLVHAAQRGDQRRMRNVAFNDDAMDELVELEPRPSRLCARRQMTLRQPRTNLGALCGAGRRMGCRESHDPLCAFRFALCLENLREATSARKLQRQSADGDRYPKRCCKIGTRTGPVAAPQRETHEQKLQPARESPVPDALRDFERVPGMSLGRVMVVRLHGELSQVRENQPARADKPMPRTDGEPLSQVRAGGLVFLLVQ